MLFQFGDAVEQFLPFLRSLMELLKGKHGPCDAPLFPADGRGSDSDPGLGPIAVAVEDIFGGGCLVIAEGALHGVFVLHEGVSVGVEEA